MDLWAARYPLPPNRPSRVGTVRPERMAGMRYRVCLVCTGNICRSPMAEAVLRAQLAEAGLADDVVVDSAGTSGWHAGEDADPRARAALRRRGYELRHAARGFDRAWFAERDLILALDEDNLKALRRLAPDAETASRIRLLRSYDADAGEELDVPDPYYGGADGFEHVLDLVERAGQALVAELRRNLVGRP
jgi:protein-tyrosine phosphatase